MEIGTINGL